MKNVNTISALIVIVFILSCLTFFGVNAEQESSTSHVPTTTTEEITTTTAEITTTTAATKATKVTTKSTTKNIGKDPTVPSRTQATAKATTVAVIETTSEYIEGGTKTTVATEATTVTEPTTIKKNITDYSQKYRWLWFVSLFTMIGSAVALVAVNVNYRRHNPKKKNKTGGKGARPNNNSGKRPASKKPTLDTSARFDSGRDISSTSRRAPRNENSFKKPEPKENDDIFGEKNNDDDLYI